MSCDIYVSVTITSVVLIDSELLTVAYIDSNISMSDGMTTCVLVRTVPTVTEFQCMNVRQHQNVKLSMQQAVEAHRVVRHRGSHIF
jgi:hypothetical protein